MKKHTQSNRQFVYLYFFVCLIFFVLRVDNCWAGRLPFIQTVLVWHPPTTTAANIADLAKYDVIDVNRFHYDDVNGATWAAIKAINPNIEIYLYQMASDVSDEKDAWNVVYLNDLGRYNVSRGHSMGTIFSHSDYFLLDSSGARIHADNNVHRWAMDFGLSSYHAYWSEATIADIVNQSWKADGIFLDGVIVTQPSFSTFDEWPAKYPTTVPFNDAMNTFANKITENFHAVNQKTYMNRGSTRFVDGYNAWIALDNMANPPDIAMEEGVFAVLWGVNSVQFFSESDWLRQVNLIGALQNTKFAGLSHTKLTTTAPDGIDNYGRAVNYWQILWYSMCSYHLARRDAPNNAYFMFSTGDPYRIIAWYDEYDRINLGAASGKYSHPQTGIYTREFVNGWIFVNPTANDVSSVNLPASGRQLTHANINTDPAKLPIITTVSVPAHNGVIVLKSAPDAPPSAPTGLAVR